jgi:hypothetical protein
VLTSALVASEWSASRPLYPRESTPVPTVLGFGRASEPMWKYEEAKILGPTGIRIATLRFPAHVYCVCDLCIVCCVVVVILPAGAINLKRNSCGLYEGTFPKTATV